MTTKKDKKDKGTIPTMVIKNQKLNEYIHVLKNGEELIFKDKHFLQKKSLIKPNGQLKMF
jgi:hypothetical protein